MKPFLITIDTYKAEAMSDDPNDGAYVPVAPLDPTAEFFCLGAPVHREVMSAQEQEALQAFSEREYGIDHATIGEAVADAMRRFPDGPVLVMNEVLGNFPTRLVEDRTVRREAVGAFLRALVGKRDEPNRNLGSGIEFLRSAASQESPNVIVVDNVARGIFT